LVHEQAPFLGFAAPATKAALEKSRESGSALTKA
jgi:hypothetical protein